jgi:undecaprenyl pyrophosphate synthase
LKALLKRGLNFNKAMYLTALNAAVKTARKMSYKDQIDLQKLPRHIAIIMDGNGRWAKGKGKLRVFGHHNGVLSVREVVEGC